MSASEFVGYLGDADFHDGSIVSMDREGDVVRVRVRGASGTLFRVEFSGVRDVRAKSPEGMLLYALCELRSDASQRRFAFANWDQDGDASLEIDAEDVSFRPE